MIEAKNDFTGGLDLDSNPYKVGKTSYIDALNVTRDALEGSNDRVITNMIGNQLVSYSYPSGRGKVIGSFPFQLRNTVIFHRWNENGYNGIYEYNHTLRSISKIFESKTDSAGIDILNYTENDKITSNNVYPRDEGDLFFWLDSLGRPSGIDIAKFKAGAYTPVTRELLDKAKVPFYPPPSCVYDNDITTRSNYLTNKLFRFKQRPHFDDFETGTWSPISAVPYPVSILNDTFTNIITNNNVIRITLNTGGKNVKSIELAMSYVDRTNSWSDFQSVIVVEKSTIGLTQTTSVTTVSTTSNAVTIFVGTAIPVGTVITIYLSGILVGSYVTVESDTITQVAAGLAADMLTRSIITGIITGATSSGGTLNYSYTTAYIFDRIDILYTTPDLNNTTFPFAFYNDSTYPTVDIAESILLYDFLPNFAGAQDMPDGNVLDYGNITEGYNKDTTPNVVITVDTVVAGNGGAIGNLTSVANPIDFVLSTAFCANSFNGIPATGTIINLKIRQRSGGAVIIGGTYTTIVGDTPNSIVSAFRVTASNATVTKRSNSIITIALGTSTYEALPSSNDWTMMEIVPPTSPLASNSVATWLWSSQRNIGRQYWDIHGKTNGVLYTDKIVFPAYAENGSHIPLIPYINYKIYDIPPMWAYSMTFCFTKDFTYPFFWQSYAVQKETAYIYFEVTSLSINATKNPTTAIVCSYVFQAGDRMRLIRRNIDNIVFSDLYDAAIVGLVVEPTINGVIQTGKQFIKIKNVEPFTSGMGSADSYVIQPYRLIQSTGSADNQAYYEDGRQYLILDPTLSTRRHSGEVSDQVVGTTPAEYNFYQGDVYFRSRTIAETATGYATFNVMDLNFVDFYISAVSSIDGRPTIIDINAKQQTFGATIRFGQAYQANTNINGLNRFYPNNLLDVDYSFGSIIRLKTRDRYQKCFQEFKIGVIPLYAELTKDGTGTVSLIVSDKLLNPIQYRVGVFGLSEGTSLASWHFADYGCDTNKAIIWRDSNDGVEPISELYRVDSWATIELPLRTGDSNIYGAIDPKKNQYIVALEAYTFQLPYFYFSAVGLNSITGTGFTITSANPFTVDWGDGTVDSFAVGTFHPTHTYSSPYTGIIKVASDNLGGISVFTIGSDMNIDNNVNPNTGALSILTSELNKLTGLVTLSLYESIYVDGIITDLASTLTSLTIRKTNLSGDIINSPRLITYFDVEGDNTISGLASNVPPNLTTFILDGFNTLFGGVILLPTTIVYLDVRGNNSLSGNVTELPPNGVTLIVEGANSLTGSVADIPIYCTAFNVTGVNTISGNVTDIPSIIISFTLNGYNTLTGDVANFNSLMYAIQVGGNNTLFGDIASLPNPLILLSLVSGTGALTYSSGTKVWHSSMNAVSVNPLTIGLSTSEVDNILIELAAQVSTWASGAFITLKGANSARSAASNAAVTTLTGLGVSVQTN